MKRVLGKFYATGVGVLGTCLGIALATKKYNDFYTKDRINLDNSLSKEQVLQFNSEGYLLIKNLFNKYDIELIKQQMNLSYDKAQEELSKYEANNGSYKKKYRIEYKKDENNSASILVLKQENEKPHIMLISWIGGMTDKLLEFGRDNKILIPVAQLLGSNKIDHLINQAHYKKPGDNIKFKLHQDLQNRRAFDKDWSDVNGKGSFIQTLVAVDKVTESNGPLIIVPNSHFKDLGLDKADDEDKTTSIIKASFPDLEKNLTPILMDPGDTLFMHPLLLHKSNINNDPENSRLLFINGFSFPGANKKPYPGKGSSQQITVDIDPKLLELTNDWTSDIDGKIDILGAD